MRPLISSLLALVIGFATLATPAAAAAPNKLLDPRASPGSGSTATVFALSVRYASDKDWPASTVTATVAGKTVTLKRTAGSAVDGTWSASTTLPQGTWPVTFSADAEQGPDPSVTGPTLTVARAATPPPTPKPTPKPTPPPTPAPTPTPAPPAPAPQGPAPAQQTPAPQPAAASPTAVSEPSTPNPSTPTPTATESPARATETGSEAASETAMPAGVSVGNRENSGEMAVLAIIALAALILGVAAVLLIHGKRRSTAAVAEEPTLAPMATEPVVGHDRAAWPRPRLEPIGPDDPILMGIGLGTKQRSEES